MNWTLEITCTVPLNNINDLTCPSNVLRHGVYFKPRQDCLLLFSLLTLHCSTLFYIQSSVYSRRSFYNLYIYRTFKKAFYNHRRTFMGSFSSTLYRTFSPPIIGAFSPPIFEAFYPPIFEAFYPPIFEAFFLLSSEHFLLLSLKHFSYYHRSIFSSYL